MLKKRVMELQEGGPTALGPALLASILMAKQSSSTAEVIICTDGIANVGLGSYEEDEEVE